MATVPGIMLDIGASVARMQQDMRKITGTVESGFAQISSAASRLGGVLAGALSVHALISLGKNALETGDKLNKLSQSTGVSVENLSALKYAAELADLDLDSLAKGIGRLSRNMFEAQQGTGEAGDAFRMLGISIADSQGKLIDSNAALGKIADRFAAMPDTTEKTALAIKIFGKSGADLIPLLNAGSKGIAELRAEAESLGLIMSAETAEAMERVNDNFKRLKSVVEGAAVQIMSRLLPTLENLTNVFFESAKGAKNFDDVSQTLATGLKLVASSGALAWAILKDVGKGLGAVAAAALAMVEGKWSEAWAIMDMEAEDSKKIWAEFGETFRKIWDKGAEDATRGSKRIKRSLDDMLVPTEATKGIEKIIAKLQEEAEALQMGGEAHELFKRGLHEASPVLKDYALYLMRFIEAHEQDKKSALDFVKAMDEEKKQFLENETALFQMVEALKIQAVTTDMSDEETMKFNLTLKGASQSLIDNAGAYYSTIRASQQYKEEIDKLRSALESIESPADKYEARLAQIQKWLDEAKISIEAWGRLQKKAWDEMMGPAGKDSFTDRERTLIDFGDRVRAQNQFTADAAIEQIDRQALAFKNAGADEVAVAIWATKEKQKASREWQDGAVRGLEEYAAAATNAAKNTEELFGNAFKTMEDSLVDFITKGEFSFKNFIDAILKDLTRLAVRQAITGPLAAGMGSIITGLFSGGGGGGAGMAAPAWEYDHAGGIVGSIMAPSKSLPAAFMTRAPRYHGGLQPDEFPTILKRGEGVFTPEQMEAMGSRTNISISIPVNMPGGDPRKAGRMRRDLETELEPAVRRIIERYI